MEKISLYIPCYNAEKTIRECLESAMGQSYEIDELLVIDDGSQDKSVEIASRYPAKIISHRKNLGLGASRNTAFREAKNEFVAALDADCVASEQWLGRLMECFTDDGIMGAGGRLIERHAVTVADKWRSTHMSQQWGDILMENPPFLYGSNTVFRKNGVRRAGFYKELFKTNYEDVDLSNRMYDNGVTLMYNPEATVVHARKDTVRSVVTTYWNWRKYANTESGCPGPVFRRTAYALAHMVEDLDFIGPTFDEDMREKNHDLLLLGFIIQWYCLWQGSKFFMRQVFHGAR